MNAFKHGLAAIQKRREEGIPTEPRGVRQAANSGRIESKYLLPPDDEIAGRIELLAQPDPRTRHK